MATELAIQATPRTIHVGPYDYAISFDAEAAYDYAYLGVTLNRSRRLIIDPRQSDTEVPQTFLHETLHAIGSAFEIPVWQRHTHDDRDQITDKIDLMASALLQFLRANPSVVSWLVNAH